MLCFRKDILCYSVARAMCVIMYETKTDIASVKGTSKYGQICMSKVNVIGHENVKDGPLLSC